MSTGLSRRRRRATAGRSIAHSRTQDCRGTGTGISTINCLPAERCVAIEDSRNGLLAAHAAGIATIVTPGVYTIGETFDEAALVVDDLSAIEFATIEALFG